MTVRFDDSLPLLIQILCEELGPAAVASGVALRDSAGRLAFFTATELGEAQRQRLTDLLRRTLGPYARPDRVIADPRDIGSENILKNSMPLNLKVNGCDVRLADRRIVGSDWLRQPAVPAPPPPRFVFCSLKGGVGRSTALSVAAADLAARGRRVLAIDLDMEAPGLGAMLLDDGTLPEFGVLDALVEDGLSPLDESFLADLLGPSALADRRGRIDVMPAFGRRTLKNPGDALAKIARAYAEDIRADGTVATILDQVRALIDRFSDPVRYDAIMIDARAGLHETTASAILGLGGDVLLFGLDEAQTFQGYAALFGHLGRFSRGLGERPEWLDRITMVHGKAPIDPTERRAFAEKCKLLFLQAEPGIQPPDNRSGEAPMPAEPFGAVPWDDSIRDEDLRLDESTKPDEPIVILSDDRFRRFDPIRHLDLLSEQIYRSSFGTYIDWVNQSILAHEQSQDPT